MNKYNSGSLMIIISIMLLVLAAGGVGGYVYLNSMDGEKEISQEESKLPEFDAGIKAGTEGDTEQNESSSSPRLGGLFSGQKNCGVVDMNEFLKDPLKTPQAWLCYGEALVSCSPAKMTYRGGGDYVYTIEGKSGTNCTTSDTGGLNLATKQKRGGISCSFPIDAAQEIYQKALDLQSQVEFQTAMSAPYAQVYSQISGSLLGEGTSKIGVTNYTATCTLK